MSMKMTSEKRTRNWKVMITNYVDNTVLKRPN